MTGMGCIKTWIKPNGGLQHWRSADWWHQQSTAHRALQHSRISWSSSPVKSLSRSSKIICSSRAVCKGTPKIRRSVNHLALWRLSLCQHIDFKPCGQIRVTWCHCVMSGEWQVVTLPTCQIWTWLLVERGRTIWPASYNQFPTPALYKCKDLTSSYHIAC